MRLRRLLFHNFWWKLTTLAAASLLWFGLVGERQLVTLQSAQVYYTGLSQDLVLLTNPSGVHLELRGPSAALNRESLNNVQILLDLSPVRTPGTHTFAISADEVTLPSGAMLLAAVPSRLMLEFDRRVTKDVPVRPDVRGQAATGYRIAAVTADPATMTVSGPESRLVGIESVPTSEIGVAGATTDLEVRASAFVVDPAVQVAAPAVTVRVRIEKGP